MFGTIVDYWYLTGDESYNDVTIQAIVHQAGPDRDFMPDNQTLTEGNDDQGFWAMATMSAAENVFPDPPEDQPQYLAITQAVFNEYVSRWEPEVCGGGLRWQIFEFNNGFDYKNTISNGCFFNVAARLARYTGNETYSEWAEKIFDWQQKVNLVNSKWEVMDGLHLKGGTCDDVDLIQWSYNSGILMHGAAVMYNLTSDDKWKKRVDGLLEHVTTKFFKNGVVYEQFCEENKLCNNDQRSFKGYLIRWMAWTSQLYPETYDTISKLIKSSVTSAMTSCSGDVAPPDFNGHPGTACGFAYIPAAQYDDLPGVGEQMNALNLVMYSLIQKVGSPATSDTGGTSKGDVNGGKSDDSKTKLYEPITVGDKVGAGFLTTLILAGVIGGCTFLIK